MTLDAAVTLARELAISAGIRGDVVSAERRGFRVVVDVGAAMAYVASDDAGGRRLALERQLLRVLQTRVPVGLPLREERWPRPARGPSRPWRVLRGRSKSEGARGER